MSKNLFEQVFIINSETDEINFNQVKQLNVIAAQDIIHRNQIIDNNKLILISEL